MRADRSFVVPFVATVLGAATFGLVDGVIGLFERGLALSGVAEHALYFLLCIGTMVALGLEVGVFCALVFGFLNRPFPVGRRLGLSVADVLIIAGAVTFVAILNQDLFRGGWIGTWRFGRASEIAFRCVAIPAFAAVLIWIARQLDGPRRRNTGILLIAAGVLLLLANRLYRHQYPAIHLQIAVAALGALAAGTSVFFTGAPRQRLTPVLAIAIVLVLFAANAGRVSALAGPLPRADAAYATRAFGVAQFEPWPTRALELFGKPKTPAVPQEDASKLLSQLARELGSGAVDHAEVAAALDRALPNRRSWNVVWIAIDTVRADHVSHLGYGRKTTPNLDRLAENAFVFERAYTAYPTSNYGFCAALTSIAARVNPVFGRRFRRSFAYPECVALPALLAKHGRDTAAVVAFDRHSLEDPVFFKELRDGFALVNPDQSEASATAPEIARSAIRVLNDRLLESAAPFFLWVHFIDPHDPYTVHPDLAFGEESIDRYDGEVAFADRHAGQVIEALEKSGRYDDTIVVVFADHGEEFNEHGGRYHNGSVYDEQTRVPLLIRVPGMKGRRVKCPVSLLDLKPTMAALLGIEDATPRHGRSLAPILTGKDDRGMAYSEVFVVPDDEPAKCVRSIVVGDKKLIHRVEPGRFELYDLARDGAERESLIGRGDPDEPMLRAVLAHWDRVIDSTFAPAPTAPLGPEIAKLIDRLTDADEGAAFEAATALRKILVGGYGTASARVTAEMSPGAIKAIYDRLAEIEPKTRGPVPLRVVTLLSERSDPAYAPLFRRVIADPGHGNEVKLRAAIALAMIDDAAGLEILREAQRHPIVPNKTDVAWALTRLGDPSGLAWYQADLNVPKWGRTLYEAVRALPKLAPLLRQVPGCEDMPAARVLRDRVCEESSRHEEVNLALVDAVKGNRDEDALLILFRLLRSEDDAVRAAASAALAGVTTEPDREKNRAAMDDEIDGDSALLNQEFNLAEASYRAALRKGTLQNIGARFRLATALHSANRADAARTVLEAIEGEASAGVDRRLARRRIGQLRWPRQSDAAKWKCTVVSAAVPEWIEPNAPFAVTFRLRNDGTEPWHGGWYIESPELHIRFVDDQGRIVEREADGGFVNRLAEEGVNPGEEVDVMVLGVATETVDRPAMTLSFRSRRAQYPDGGIVWREARGKNASAPK